MDSELAVLAASGATTLASFLVTDSWTRARELVGRYLSRTGADPDTFDDLQDTRTGSSPPTPRNANRPPANSADNTMPACADSGKPTTAAARPCALC
ncbi:hypothetical protein [Streptomyces tauricus]|uniref:hypothetical protein n=1 Tax=Streptomyces tauricus TaxID=68274 RepID=UPI0033A384EE